MAEIIRIPRKLLRDSRTVQFPTTYNPPEDDIIRLPPWELDLLKAIHRYVNSVEINQERDKKEKLG